MKKWIFLFTYSWFQDYFFYGLMTLGCLLVCLLFPILYYVVLQSGYQSIWIPKYLDISLYYSSWFHLFIVYIHYRLRTIFYGLMTGLFACLLVISNIILCGITIWIPKYMDTKISGYFPLLCGMWYYNMDNKGANKSKVHRPDKSSELFLIGHQYFLPTSTSSAHVEVCIT